MGCLLSRRKSEKLAIAWVTKLGLLLAMDAPVMLAVARLKQDHDLRRLQEVSNDIGVLLQSGWTLAEALQKHTDTFGSLYLYVMTAEHTGTLGTAMAQIAAAYAQLQAIAVPVGVSYAPVPEDAYTLESCLVSAQQDGPAIRQANELFMALLNGAYSAPGNSIVVEQSYSGEFSCAAYAMLDGVAKNIMALPWTEGCRLQQRILLMANMNYWEKSPKAGWTRLKIGELESEFAIQREQGESGQMKVTITKKTLNH